MNRILRRFPNWAQLELIFIACAFPINLWAIFHFLRVVPSFVRRMTWMELLVVASYNQALAFVESVFVVLCLVVFGVLLPKFVLRDKWVAKSAVLIFVLSLWMVLYHYFNVIIPLWKRLSFGVADLLNLAAAEESLLSVSFSVFLLLWVGLLFVVPLGLYRSLGRREAFAPIIHAFLARISVLTWVYVTLDMFGLVFVVVRGIF